MQYELDDRGGIVPGSLRMTPAEVAKRGWMTRPMSAIPHWAQDEVKRHREAREEAWHRSEMERRYGQNYEQLPQQDPMLAPDGKRQMLERLQAQQQEDR